jgi:predicted RND superfamily exporter protein
MIKSIIRILIQKDQLFAIVTFTIILVFAVFSRIPDIDGQLSGLDIEKTHYFQSGKKIAKAFGIKDFIEVKVSPKDTSSSVVFNNLEDIEKKLRSNFDDIEIRSIHNARALFRSSLNSNKNIRYVLRKAASIPIIDNLISKDRESFLIIVTFNSDQEIDIRTFDQILDGESSGIKSLISMSTPHVELAVERSLKKDVLSISVLMLLVFSLIILYTFQDIRALIYVTIIILVSILPTFFFFTVLNISLNLITALTIPIILVLSLADAIHLLTGYYSYNGKDLNKRINSSMGSYAIPSFLTSLTTTIAFSSFLFNSAESIRIFGLIVSLSVLPSFIFTYILTPFLFKHLVRPKLLPEHGIRRILKVLRRVTKPITYSLILMAILAIPLVSQLKFNTNFENFIPQNSPILKNRNELMKDFDSQLSIHILIEKDTIHSSKTRLQVEEDILEIAEKFNTIPTVGKVKSIKDELQFKKAFGPFSKYISIPRKNNPYVVNNNCYRLELRLTTMDSLQHVKDNLIWIINQYNGDYQYEIFSKALLLDEINKKVAVSFLKSLLFSFILIFLTIFVFPFSMKGLRFFVIKFNRTIFFCTKNPPTMR